MWSEKGTVRGLLKPVLDEYGVGFFPVHGFCGGGEVYNRANFYDGRPMHLLYCGDFDPSGMCMSEVDLPKRFEKYGGNHIIIDRIALRPEDTVSLPSFPASDKKKDSRYEWFVSRYGKRCWELDAMDPNVLRERVRESIEDLIEPKAWKRCAKINAAEQKSLRHVLDRWQQP